MKPYDLRPCAKACALSNTPCPIEECRLWIDYKEDNNCTLIAVDKNGHMTLDQVGKRLGVSLVTIKKIEDKVKIKLKNNPNWD